MVMTQSLVLGSLAAIAQQKGVSLAESFLSADVIAIVDVSGSMDAGDSRNGRRRYDVAIEELATLQRDAPGKVAVVAFSDTVQFCPGGVPPFLGSGTNLAAALEFVRAGDGLVQFIVVSDGQPNNPEKALKVARGFKNKIDVVYVGAEGDRSGARFLQELAAASGGQFVTADCAKQLAEKTRRLMLK